MALPTQVTSLAAAVSTTLAKESPDNSSYLWMVKSGVEKALKVGNAAQATLTTSATDTTAGRVTKVGDFGSGDKPINLYPAGLNLDDPNIVGGRYQFFADTNVTGTLPTGLNAAISCVLEVVRQNQSFSGQQINQKLTTFRYNNNREFIRSYNLTLLTWTAWKEIYTTGNILGTVSQSGGVPTGAIIERGSNADGEYVKFADGTLICTFYVDYKASNTMTVPDSFEDIGLWTFPSQFSSPSAVTIAPFHNGVNSLARTFVTSNLRSSTTSASQLCYGFYGATSGLNVGHIRYAIGRWY